MTINKYDEVNCQKHHQATYSISHVPDTHDKYFPYASPEKSGIVLLPELVLDTPGFRTELALSSTSILYSLYLGEYKISLFILPIFLLTFLYFAYLKLTKEVRYFLIHKGKITLKSKRDGSRIYRTKDLKFHLSSIGLDNRYHFEMELPDISLPWARRVILLEVTEGIKTMEGIVAVLFPLLRGELGPYSLAKKRGYEPLPKFQNHTYAGWDENNLCYQKRYSEKEEPQTLLKHLDNYFEHLIVKFLHYQDNHFLFWLVHGSREKLLAKEQQRGAS
jgi:hypothetical protein